MKKMIGLLLVVAMLVACIGVAMAQQYQNPQGGMQTGDQTGAQTGASSDKLVIPPAPPKAVANMSYGNTARAAIIGERMSDASQGNANVFINEGNIITADVYLNKDASPYDIAGTMANFTYMLADLYSMTDKAKSDIALKVYDTSGNVIIDAKFNNAKNAFDYFNVPESATPTQQPVAPQPGISAGISPGMQQPGMQQPGMQRPGMQQPGCTCSNPVCSSREWAKCQWDKDKKHEVRGPR